MTRKSRDEYEEEGKEAAGEEEKGKEVEEEEEKK